MASMAGGNNPNPHDTRWTIWFKILAELQGRAGADPANNPNGHESLWLLKHKVNKALT